MSSLSLPSSLDSRAILHAHLDAMLDESERVMNNAAYGQMVNNLDTFFLDKGRKFIQEVFRQKLQERIEKVEAEDATKHCPKCKKKWNIGTNDRKP